MDGIIEYTPTIHTDKRGDLFTIWEEKDFLPNIKFIHDKVATSKKDVLRGLHGDDKSWKLITCLHGEIFLAVVDFRMESKNYLKWESYTLNDKNKKMILVPPMFLNGHLVLSESAVFYYKWAYEGDYPDVNDQISVHCKNSSIGIKWPMDKPILSERDNALDQFTNYGGYY